MKRILTAILCAGILAVTAVGCSYNDALYKDGNSSSQTSEDSTQPTTSSVKDDKYSNDLDGLVDYFVAKGYLESKDGSIKMDASAIGAKEGKSLLQSMQVQILSLSFTLMIQRKRTAQPMRL